MGGGRWGFPEGPSEGSSMKAGCCGASDEAPKAARSFVGLIDAEVSGECKDVL